MRNIQRFHFRISVPMMAMTALLTAVHVILSRFFSITLNASLRISFGFLPTAIAGMMFGPISAMIVGGLGDFIGALSFPTGAFFPGFTLTEILCGLTYGLCFFKREPLLLRHILLSKLIVNLFIYSGLNTLWIMLISTSGQGYAILLPPRLLKNALQLPVDTLILLYIIPLVKQLPLPGFLHERR